MQEITTFFTPIKHKARQTAHVEIDKAERKRMKDRDRKRAEYKPKREEGKPSPRSVHYWQEVENTVMKAMRSIKTNVHINDVIVATKLSKATVANTLRRLVNGEQIMTTGGRGRYRRYHMPS